MSMRKKLIFAIICLLIINFVIGATTISNTLSTFDGNVSMGNNSITNTFSMCYSDDRPCFYRSPYTQEGQQEWLYLVNQSSDNHKNNTKLAYLKAKGIFVINFIELYPNAKLIMAYPDLNFFSRVNTNTDEWEFQGNETNYNYVFKNMSARFDNNVNVTGDLVTTKILDADGTMTLGGTGGSNNEDLTFDFETESNTVHVDSTTGVTGIFYDKPMGMRDDTNLLIGRGFDVKHAWETTGNDNYQIGLIVGAAANSGYISIMEGDDMGNENRSPSGTSANPVLRVYSSDAGQSGDYIEMYHDQTNGIFNTGGGAIKFYSNNGVVNFGGADLSTFSIEDAGTAGMFMFKADKNKAQMSISSRDTVGNQIIIGSYDAIGGSKDFDHAVTTDPTLFIHSDTDPDTDNTQWLSLSHNQADAHINVGKGDLVINTTAGAQYAQNDLVFENPSQDGKVGISMKNDAQEWQYFLNGADGDRWMLSDQTGTPTFPLKVMANTPDNTLVLDSNGRLGILNNAPAEELDVNGDVNVNGSLFVENKVTHIGDTNTELQVTADQWNVVTGGSSRMTVNNNGVQVSNGILDMNSNDILEVDEMNTTGDINIDADDKKTCYGADQDACIYWNGTALIIE